MTDTRKQDFGPLLTSDQQYRFEVGQLPTFTQEQEQVLLEQARAGDREARNQIISACLPYITRLAQGFAHSARHADFLDLCQMASLEMLECLDQALQVDYPFAYLVKAARWSLVRYLQLKDGLIMKKAHADEGCGHKTVLSLDKPLDEDGSDWKNLLADSSWYAVSSPSEQDYAALYLALASLPDRHRQVIERYYGLNGCPHENLPEIEVSLTGRVDPKVSLVRHYKRRAVSCLRQRLETTVWVDTLVCEECGEVYPRRRCPSRYCGERCSKRASVRRYRQRQRQEVA